MSLASLTKRALGRAGLHLSRTDRAEALIRWTGDEAFGAACAAAAPVTLLGTDRLFTLWQYARATRALPGVAAQLGVYQGGSALLISRALEGSGKTLHLFDTFAGMPAVDAAVDLHKKDDFNDTSLAAVQQLFPAGALVTFYPGHFPETAAPLAGERFSFVYLDADIYQSTKDALAFFYPRMTPGGAIVFDDYRGKHTPGVEKALTEYLADKPERPLVTAIAQCALIKA